MDDHDIQKTMENKDLMGLKIVIQWDINILMGYTLW
jgi:hypothetical protein